MIINIRQEKEEDIKDIYIVNQLAFGQDNESKLIDLLRQSNSFIPEISLVATIESQIAGHILFSKVSVVSSNGMAHESLALAPMAVHPDFQRQGIGRRLIKYGLKTATQLGYKSVIVLGHEDYYPKFGFVPASKWHIQAPFDVPANAFMALELVPNALKGISGIVSYPKEFENV